MGFTQFFFLGCIACAALASEKAKSPSQVAALLKTELPQLGHRNWIVVADSAYPLQTSAGIKTVVVTESQVACVKDVLAALALTKHVRPHIYLDKELAFVPENLAPGISEYRSSLTRILAGRPTETLLHEDIIKRLDEAGKTFTILLIKTPHIQPYTTVFFQLECGYWSDSAEKQLRETMAKGSH
jgi:L-fucose mutarotase/ribose pyranase (RbsD/FucU family)